MNHAMRINQQFRSNSTPRLPSHLGRRRPTFSALLLALTITVLSVVSANASAAETLTFIHTDALGSPVAATDQQGNVIWREEYKPHGERLKNEPAAQGNARWFTGHSHDAASGLSYMGARYYDSVVGRFMGVDPVSFQESQIHSFNRYSYGNNNPYAYVDLDGKLAFYHHYWITFNAARDRGFGVLASANLAWQTMMIDFSPGSQGLSIAATSQHFMAGVGENGAYQSRGEAIQSGYSGIESSISRGNLARALHAAQDAPADGHAGKEWRGLTLVPPSVSCLLGCSERERESRRHDFVESRNHLRDDLSPSTAVKQRAYDNSQGVFELWKRRHSQLHD